MVAKTLDNFLKKNNVKYVTITHSPAYTVQDIAQISHIPGKTLAKSVIVTLGNKMAMVVIPGDKKIDLDALKRTSNEEDVHLASETEFKSKFSDCEVGAMPPFGNLYGMPVYVDTGLSTASEIGFNAGTHSELVKMSYSDFDTLVHPQQGKFTQ